MQLTIDNVLYRSRPCGLWRPKARLYRCYNLSNMIRAQALLLPVAALALLVLLSPCTSAPRDGAAASHLSPGRRAPAPAAAAAPVARGRYFLSASIDFGRFSNARVSLAESLALARLLNRTAVLPPLECCRDTSTAALGIFDAAALAAAVPVVSRHAFDFSAACEDGGGGGSSADTGATDSVPGDAARGWLYVDSGASAFMSEEPSAFRGRMPTRLPGGSLVEALVAAVRELDPACVVLSKHFRVLDPDVSSGFGPAAAALAAVHAQMQPHAVIAGAAASFLERHSLSARTFVGVHLRQTDFLRPGHRSFASACNAEPELLLRHVRNAVAALGPTSKQAVVIASDDYETVCARALLSAFPGVHVLRRASFFLPGSCEEAALEQEVLGRSARFVGDGISSFSEAILHIRRNRRGFGKETSLLLRAHTEETVKDMK